MNRLRAAYRSKKRNKYAFASSVAGVLFFWLVAGNLTVSTRSLLTDTTRAADSISAAFVFPNTVYGMASRVSELERRAEYHYWGARMAGYMFTQAKDMSEFLLFADQMVEYANAILQDEQEALQLLHQLQDYRQKAQSDVEARERRATARIVSMGNSGDPSASENVEVQSARAVLAYVEDAFRKAEGGCAGIAKWKMAALEMERNHQDLVRLANKRKEERIGKGMIPAAGLIIGEPETVTGTAYRPLALSAADAANVSPPGSVTNDVYHLLP